MNCALIVAGIVANLAVGCPINDNRQWIESDTAKIGDTYDGTTFISPPKVNNSTPLDFTDSISPPLLKWVLSVENDRRAAKGQAAITLNQLKAALKALP